MRFSSARESGRLGLRAVALLIACASPLAEAQTNDCSTLGQNNYVRAALREYYYWYRDLPDPDPTLFDSPEAYLEAVRYRALDSGFSYIAAEAASDAFYSESQYVGFGFRTKLVEPGDLRVAEAFPDSPASAAGLDRNVRILEIDGRSIADLEAAGQLDSAFGPTQIGHSVRLRIQTPDGASRTVEMAKAVVTIPTVAAVRTFDVAGRRVGYVLFQNFVQPSVAALDAAFAQLGRDGAMDLVLDLRYNGGGLVSVAQHLASLIGGMRTSGRVMARYVHNDKNTHRNTELFFSDPAQALSVPRVTVITTRSSASASELIVNSLKAFFPVATIGENTFGKPVGQYGFRFCGKILWPVAFSMRNANNEGDFFGGFPPTCAAPDDLGHALGAPEEGSLRAALHYVVNGACDAATATRARAARRELRQPHEAHGFRRLVGAY